MARSFGAMVTYNDINYMVDNEGWALNGGRINSNRALSEVNLSSYTNVIIDGTYANNQLVAWQDIYYGIKADISEKSISHEAGDFTFTLTYEYNPWTISDNMPWLTVSPTSGNGETLITVSYSENTSTISPRTGTITLVDATDPSISFEIEVTQSINPGIPTDPISLYYGSTNLERCDTDTPLTRYIPDGQTWDTATQLYSNSGGTIQATSGWYNDGTRWREWDGSSFVASGFC